MNMPKGPLTNILTALNIAVYLILWLLNLQQQGVVQFALIPARFTGAVIDPAAYGFWLPAAATLLTHAFLHVEFTHLLFNVLILFFCGRFVELALGWKLMGLLYVLGALAGGFAEILWSPSSMNPVLGASGAISAMIAGYMLLFARNRPKPVGPIPGEIVRMVQLMGLWLVLNVMMSFTFGTDQTGIAVAAHIGGFLVGLLLARPLLIWRYRGA